MIKINELNTYSQPYKVFISFYNEAIASSQPNVEAAAISSFNKDTEEVNSRFVNIKYISEDEWIFFSNYNAPKNTEFLNNKKISVLFYWHKINVQIRIKADIKKSSKMKSDNHFSKRSIEKNALAISSNQSMEVESYDKVIYSYNSTLNDLKKNKNIQRPSYWGGYSFKPYYFEFWEGHRNRLNKRTIYKRINSEWTKGYLQP